jgi:hypothetical protein
MMGLEFEEFFTDIPWQNQRSPRLGLIEIIKGSTIVMISPKTELNLVNFVKQVLP